MSQIFSTAKQFSPTSIGEKWSSITAATGRPKAVCPIPQVPSSAVALTQTAPHGGIQLDRWRLYFENFDIGLATSAESAQEGRRGVVVGPLRGGRFSLTVSMDLIFISCLPTPKNLNVGCFIQHLLQFVKQQM